MGLPRNTVRKYLRGGGKVMYGPREPRACKLDPFKRNLLERIEHARPDWIPATVLTAEIRQAPWATASASAISARERGSTLLG
jgi:transposase